NCSPCPPAAPYAHRPRTNGCASNRAASWRARRTYGRASSRRIARTLRGRICESRLPEDSRPALRKPRRPLSPMDRRESQRSSEGPGKDRVGAENTQLFAKQRVVRSGRERDAILAPVDGEHAKRAFRLGDNRGREIRRGEFDGNEAFVPSLGSFNRNYRRWQNLLKPALQIAGGDRRLRSTMPDRHAAEIVREMLRVFTLKNHGDNFAPAGETRPDEVGDVAAA